MFIREIYIEGFGIFHDRPFRFSPHLNVIYGPNEAGKSTLLAFIQHLLFGFPDGRSRERRYEALRGGRLGGRLVFEDDGGARYTIERFAGVRGGELTVRLPDGNTGTEDTLRDILGNTTKDVFCKIFAFGLDELQVFSTLQDEGVRSHIYSAGTGGISISEIESQLRKKADDLFRPRASNPTINQLLKEVDQQSQDLRELSYQSEDYDRFIAQRDAFTRAIETETKEIAELEENIQRLLRYQDAWEPWRELVGVQEALDSLDMIDDFPEDGKNRLKRIEENLSTFKKEIQDVEGGIENLNQRGDQLPVDDKILQFEKNIESLRSDRNLYETQRQQCSDLERDLQNHEEELRDTLHQLGQDWTEERVEIFDGSIQAQEEIRHFKTQLEKTSGDHQDLQRQVDEAKRHVEDAQLDLKDLKQQSNGDADFSEVDYRERRSLFQKLMQLQARYSALADADFSQSQGSMLPAWPTAVLIVLALMVGMGGWASDFAKLGGAVGGFLLLLVFGYWALRRKMSQQTSPYNSTGRSTQTLKKCEQDIEVLAGQFDIESIPSEEDITRIQNDLEKTGELIQAHKGREIRIEEVKTEVLRKKQTLERLRSACDQAEQAFQEVEKEWETFLDKHRLSKTLSPDSALLVINEIKTARDRLGNVQAERQRLDSLREDVDHFETQVREVAEGCDREEGEGQSVLSLVDYLIRELDTNRENKRDYEGIQEDLRDQETQLKHLKEQQREEESAFSELLGLVNAEDAETFRDKQDTYEKRQDLLGQERRYRQEVERLLGVGDKYTQAMDALKQTSLAELKDEVEKLNEQRDVKQTECDAKREELGGIRTSIENMESQGQASELRLQHQADCEKLNTLAAEWASWTVAKALLTQARTFYEKERRPGVIKEAESIFAQMTDGCYTQILAPLDGSDIQVGDQNGGVRGIGNLSRGTAEQLYLSLRMGLIREFGRNAQILPVLMDDIAVNFDPERATQAVCALHQLSDDHQIVVFTCHPATRELFQKLDTEAEINLVELDRQSAFTGWVSQVREHTEYAAVTQEVDIEALGDYILDALDGRSLGILELEDDLKVERGQLRPVLEKLRNRGQVDTEGRGRGTKWVLVK